MVSLQKQKAIQKSITFSLGYRNYIFQGKDLNKDMILNAGVTYSIFSINDRTTNALLVYMKISM